MIKAVIFDMDGLLIDSEPLWRKAELEEFNSIGVTLTPSMAAQTMGLRTDEVVAYWYKRYPWTTPSQQVVSERLDKRVLQIIKDEGLAKEGVSEVISACKNAGLPMAVASSSSRILINTVLQKFGIKDDMSVIHSAHDETYGKPHPAVYLTTAQELGVHPDQCLAFEDSINGVLSAKAAKMKCIAIPELDTRDDKRFGIADDILHSLKAFKIEMLGDL